MGYANTVALGDTFEFSSAIYTPLAFTTVAADVIVGNIGLPSTISGTIRYAFLSLDIARLWNSGLAENYIADMQYVTCKLGGTEVVGLGFPGGSLRDDRSVWVVHGIKKLGNENVKAAFAWGSNTEITWKSAKAFADNLYLRDVVASVRIIV